MTQTRSGRQSHRHKFIVLTDYSNGEQDLFAFCKDVSQGGLFIKTMNPAKIGTIITVKFKFPHDLSEFTTKAVVQWIRETPLDELSAGMGLIFIDQTEDEKKQLAEHLNFCEKI